MEPKAFRVYRGPSIYSQRPVIRSTFDSWPAEIPRLSGSNTNPLLSLLPGLRRRHVPCLPALLEQNGIADGATPVLHLYEHLCIELQNLAGAKLDCVRARGVPIPPGDAVIPFDDENVGLEAGKVAQDFIQSLVFAGPPFDGDPRLEAFLRFAERNRLPAQDQAFVREAESRDIPVIRIAGRILQLGHGCRQQRLSGTKTSHTNVVSNDLAASKDAARQVFQTFDLPIPRYERVQGIDEAVAAAERIGYPVVVKPNGGNMGIGVSVGMKTAREVREAYDRSRGFGGVLVEEFVAGADYRMLVINGRLEAAARRIPAHVTGDGVQTIEQLVRRANQDPRRGAGQRGSWTRLELTEESDRLLAERGYRRDSIPYGGEVVALRRVANTSAGGTAVDVTDQVHPENREIAERAAIAIGLDVAGVDLLVSDISQPMRAQGGVICEINSRPGLRKHLWPAEGQPRDVIRPIVDMLFPTGSSARIPIAVVTGVGAIPVVARALAELLATDGTIVGLAAHDGAFVGGRRVDGGGLTGASATRLLMLDPTVETAVIEVSPNDALESGLGYDRVDACVVVNDRVIEPSEVEALALVVGSALSDVVMSEEDERMLGSKLRPGARIRRLGGSQPAALYAAALAECLGRTPADVEHWMANRPDAHAR